MWSHCVAQGSLCSQSLQPQDMGSLALPQSLGLLPLLLMNEL